jgi:hypothetical protein
MPTGKPLSFKEGHKVGNTILTFLEELTKKGKSHRRGLFKCACGKTRCISLTDVNTGHTKSCGCLRAEQVRFKNTIHGASGRKNKQPCYVIWGGMKARCCNPNHKAYHRYGARGVKPSEDWMTFEGFQKWLESHPRPSSEHELHRKDNTGLYSAENCEWALPHEHALEKRVRVDRDERVKPIIKQNKDLKAENKILLAKVAELERLLSLK